MKPVLPKLDDQVCRTLLSAIRDTPGREICGFLVELENKIAFRRIPNFGGAGEFWIDEISLGRILGDIARTPGVIRGFVHSHFSDTDLSSADVSSLRRSPWPWLVVVARERTLRYEWFWNGISKSARGGALATRTQWPGWVSC